jgi:hypothetical protein
MFEYTLGFFDQILRKSLLKQFKINRIQSFINGYIDRMINNEKVSLKIIALKSIIERSNINCFSRFLEKVERPVQTEIDLKLCFLSKPLTLLKSLGMKTTLINLSLNLFLTNLNNRAIKILSISLKNLVNLSKLNLNIRNNSVEDDGISLLFETISLLGNLEVLILDLSFNRILNLGQNLIELRNLLKLTQLHIFFDNNQLMCNGLELEGTIKLSSVLSNLKYLSKLSLDLSSNNISIEGFISIISSLVELPYLYYIKIILKDNNICSKEYTNGILPMCLLTKQIEKLSQIKNFQINLKKNLIDNVGIFELLKSFKSIIGLNDLYLDITNNPFNIDLSELISLLKKGIKCVEICLK